MQITLYDRGSPKGKKLFTDLDAACQKLQIFEEPIYSQDMKKIYNQGLAGNTILMINHEVVFVDRYPNQKELENILSDYL